MYVCNNMWYVALTFTLTLLVVRVFSLGQHIPLLRIQGEHLYISQQSH